MVGGQPLSNPTKVIDNLDMSSVGVKAGSGLPGSGDGTMLIGVAGTEDQTEYARRLAHMLNVGVLQDAVAAGLEEQGQFEIDTIDLLDALQSAGLELAPRADTP